MKYRVSDRFIEADGLPFIGEGVLFGDNVRVGKNVRIWNYTVIQNNCVIGNNSVIGSFCDVGKDVKIGNNTQIQAHCTISNECVIGNNVFIGPNTTLLNDKFPNSPKLRPVIIKDNVVISGGVIVLPDVIINENAFVAGASVVTKDVDVGVAVKSPIPARPYCSRDEFNRKKMTYVNGPHRPH